MKPKILKKIASKNPQEQGRCFASCGGSPFIIQFETENHKKTLKSKPISKFSLFNNLTFVYKKINKLSEAQYYATKALQLLKNRSKEYQETKVAQIFRKQFEKILKLR